jgi:hypothetical protein
MRGLLITDDLGVFASLQQNDKQYAGEETNRGHSGVVFAPCSAVTPL